MQQHYVSEDGLKKLQDEMKERETVTRREIAEKIGVAKEQGDLSENFEYQEAKEQQAHNETRIIELNELIKSAVIIKQTTDDGTIQIGTSFTVVMNDGVEKSFEIVGATESDPLNGKISNESPLGNRFLGAKVHDVVEIETPAGITSYTVTSIS